VSHGFWLDMIITTGNKVNQGVGENENKTTGNKVNQGVGENE